MEPAIPLALLFLVFAGTHIGLASAGVRPVLVARLGRWGFTCFFTAVAAISFTAFFGYYATHAADGAAGPALGRIGALRWLGVGAIGAGFALMAGALADFRGSPMRRDGAGVREPRGLARITRHPFFVGVFLFGGAHALLATRLVGAVAMGGLALFALVGARHQDRKLRRELGESYEAYLAASSATPFAAIAAGRQRLVWGELPWLGLALGLGLAFAVRSVHGGILAYGGAFVTGPVVGGALFILLGEWLRDRRRSARTPARATL